MVTRIEAKDVAGVLYFNRDVDAGLTFVGYSHDVIPIDVRARAYARGLCAEETLEEWAQNQYGMSWKDL